MKSNKVNFVELHNEVKNEEVAHIIEKATKTRKLNLAFYSGMSIASTVILVGVYKQMANAIVDNPQHYAELVKNGDFKVQIMGLLLIALLTLINIIVAIETFASSPADEMTITEVNKVNKVLVKKAKESGTSFLIGNKNKLGYHDVKKIKIRA